VRGRRLRENSACIVGGRSAGSAGLQLDAAADPGGDAPVVRASAGARPRRGRLRGDFEFPDLALLLWSFSPLIDATVEAAPNAWRRHLHWLLDGIRADSATPQAEPPLSAAQLQAAIQALRSRRLGRRGG
jgi:hypothetical protein